RAALPTRGGCERRFAASEARPDFSAEEDSGRSGNTTGGDAKLRWVGNDLGRRSGCAALFGPAMWLHLREQRGQPIDSVAVLPFVNEDSDPNTEYLSDGITEGIINKLSELPRLRILARSTVFRSKGRQDDPQRIGRDLSVRAVLTGRVANEAADCLSRRTSSASPMVPK